MYHQKSEYIRWYMLFRGTDRTLRCLQDFKNSYVCQSWYCHNWCLYLLAEKSWLREQYRGPWSISPTSASHLWGYQEDAPQRNYDHPSLSRERFLSTRGICLDGYWPNWAAGKQNGSEDSYALKNLCSKNKRALSWTPIFAQRRQKGHPRMYHWWTCRFLQGIKEVC